MMSASMQGAMAFQKGLGCVHSLSHSLGGANPKLHHGTLNAMFLPAVVKFNASAPIDRRRSGAWSAWRMRWAWPSATARRRRRRGDPRHERAPRPALGPGRARRRRRDVRADHRRRDGRPLPQDQPAAGDARRLRRGCSKRRCRSSSRSSSHDRIGASVSTERDCGFIACRERPAGASLRRGRRTVRRWRRVAGLSGGTASTRTAARALRRRLGRPGSRGTPPSAARRSPPTRVARQRDLAPVVGLVEAGRASSRSGTTAGRCSSRRFRNSAGSRRVRPSR